MVRSSRKTLAKGLLIGALALLISGIAGCEAGTTLRRLTSPGLARREHDL